MCYVDWLSFSVAYISPRACCFIFICMLHCIYAYCVFKQFPLSLLSLCLSHGLVPEIKALIDWLIDWLIEIRNFSPTTDVITHPKPWSQSMTSSGVVQLYRSAAVRTGGPYSNNAPHNVRYVRRRRCSKRPAATRNTHIQYAQSNDTVFVILTLSTEVPSRSFPIVLADDCILVLYSSRVDVISAWPTLWNCRHSEQEQSSAPERLQYLLLSSGTVY